MICRLATAADVPAMERARALDVEAGPPDTRMAKYLAGKHHPQQALPTRVGFVALDAGSVIGYVAGHLTRRYECDGELQYLYVIPSRRQQGVATSLVRLLARWFVAQRASRICVNVNDESAGARPFYARHGAIALHPHWMVWSDVITVVDPRDEALRATLKSQYHASLAMLGEAIERCPDDEWESDEHKNAFWQVAYHTLYFTHLYLQPRSETFRPWEGHQSDVQHEDGIAGAADPMSTLPLIPRPYARQQVLEYWAICDGMVDSQVDALDLHGPESGFHWYKMPKLEHQLVSLRHIQHHGAQLADRLRASAGIGIKWVGGRRER